MKNKKNLQGLRKLRSQAAISAGTMSFDNGADKIWAGFAKKVFTLARFL